MGRRRSLVRQGTEKLLGMAAFGDSKFEDKKVNGGFPAREKIYSSVTMDNYIDYVSRFLRWAQKNYGCRYLEESRQYVAEYLRQRIQTQSAWTVRAEAAGIAKLFQVSMNDFGVELPERSRDDIEQHRGEKWIGHFSPERNKDLVAFCLATGLRRHEVEKSSPDDVWEEDGNIYVKTVGKGGKFRIVKCLNDAPLKIAQVAEAAGQSLIFAHVPKYAPIHEFRAQFAKILYDVVARPMEELPRNEQYICRGKKQGIVYDKNALSVVSVALGHGNQRLDVVADNYLYKQNAENNKCNSGI